MTCTKDNPTITQRFPRNDGQSGTDWGISPSVSSSAHFSLPANEMLAESWGWVVCTGS